jgi:capsular polysaccharide biosynthesis protein
MVVNGRGTGLTALSELKRRWLLILTVTVAAAGAAAAYSFTAPKHYRSQATLVVSPVALSDPTFLGLDVLHDSSRRSAAATAAQLVPSAQVAEAVRVRLGLSGTAQSLLDDVSVRVLVDSNVVGVTATATEPKRAAQVANGFVDAFISQRSAGFESEVASAIKRLRSRVAELTPAQRLTIQGMRIEEQLGNLRARVGTGDPTVRHGTEAVEPESASSPHPVWWTIIAALLGLVIGCVAALVIAVTTAIRRRDAAYAVVATTFTPAAAERRVERSAERVAERLDHLDDELDRLTERLVTASEQVPVESAPAESQEDDSERERELAERAEVLASRERALARHASELTRREGELSELEHTLAERAQDVDAQAEELRRRAEEDELRRREHEAELQRRAAEEERQRRAAEEERQRRAKEEAELRRHEHEAELERRAAEEEELRRRAEEEELQRRTAEEERRRRAEEAARREPAPEPTAVASPPPAAPPVPAPNGAWRLAELERLVEANAAAYPNRIDEWRSYLFYLRDYADPGGHLPGHFDWLIEDTFGELLVTR